MANYCATARSNYFKVKDVEAFKKWLDTVGSCKFIQDKEGRVGFYVDDDGMLPSTRCNDRQDESEELDLCAEIAQHLLPEEVAIVMEVGAEKCRYLSGFAHAVNSAGKVETVSIDQIYGRAKKLGKHITMAEY